MSKEPTPKQRAAQLDKQLAFWEASSRKNKAEKAEFAKLRALGKAPSVVDRFDVQKYQKSVMAFNSKIA